MRIFGKDRGFTLIEVIVVIAIIAIMVVVAIPSYLGYINSIKATVDQVTVRELNNKTGIYRLNTLELDPFENTSNSDEKLLKLLVDGEFFDKEPVPLSKGVKFSWNHMEQLWYISNNFGAYKITLQDGLEITKQGWFFGLLKGKYNGEAKNISIPSSLDGVVISGIWQEVFEKKGLLEVSFDMNSSIKQIHARAFQINKLTKIEFPNSLERIDQLSFSENRLTEISLPANIHTIERRAFNGNNLQKISIGSKVAAIGYEALGEYTDQFKSAYLIGGAGTYQLIGGNWIKE